MFQIRIQPAGAADGNTVVLLDDGTLEICMSPSDDFGGILNHVSQTFGAEMASSVHSLFADPSFPRDFHKYDGGILITPKIISPD